MGQHTHQEVAEPLMPGYQAEAPGAETGCNRDTGRDTPHLSPYKQPGGLYLSLPTAKF